LVHNAHIKSSEKKRVQFRAPHRLIDRTDALAEVLGEDRTDIHLAAEEDVREILQYERAAVATDALLGGEPHPRTYGTYPCVLRHYARDESLFSVEGAVRMMTSLPARMVGLDSKDLLRLRMDAESVAFDPHYVTDTATFDELRQFPEGIPHVALLNRD
jgi:N-acyl-D-amino-acid deacylase